MKNNRIKDSLLRIIFRVIKKLPAVHRKIEKEYESIIPQLEESLKPYRDEGLICSRIPEKGLSRKKIITEMKRYLEREQPGWEKGGASGAVYHGDPAHIDFLNKVYALQSQSNPLHADLWPSTVKFEAEIVSMAASMLGRDTLNEGEREQVCGTVSSGGTESILLAMKTYRDWGRHKKGIRRPEIVIPETAHAAFEKAADFFKMKLKKVPVTNEYKADLKAVKSALSRNTVVLIGSAPSFPHGIIDPIEEMSELARKREIGFHTDACLGGFILPWVKKLGRDVPSFDFSLPGVTSISVDTHKYGFASKGTSVILYRNHDLRHYQFFKSTDWPGGLYFSPTLAGSRPGGLSAACWAAIISTGEEEYLASTREILETADYIKKKILEIPEIRIMGNPLWNIAFTSDELDIYRIMEQMSRRGWSLNGLHRPPAVHICLTRRHTVKGVRTRFIRDLRNAIQYVRDHPDEEGTMAPVYGMAATLPDREIVSDILDLYMDVLYRV